MDDEIEPSKVTLEGVPAPSNTNDTSDPARDSDDTDPSQL